MGALPGGMGAGGPGQIAATTAGQADLVSAINTTAANLGISPMDSGDGYFLRDRRHVAARLSWVARAASALGLIQFGPTEAAMYGASASQTAAEQMAAVEAYLRDRGA